MQLPNSPADATGFDVHVEAQQQPRTLRTQAGAGTPVCADAGAASIAHAARVEPASFAPAVHPSERQAAQGPAVHGAYARAVRPAVGALLVALMAVPVAAAAAVLVLVQLSVYRRTSDVFFFQTRAGRFGKPFRIVKFRTMDRNEEGVLEPTPLGALLRKSHLDELPQLWNVVRGEMSLIGPRPETLDLEEWGEKEVPGFQSRLNMRPGITGLAQVVQDSTPAVPELYQEKLRLNRLYERNISLRMDAWILFRTAVRPVRPRAFEHSILKAG